MGVIQKPPPYVIAADFSCGKKPSDSLSSPEPMMNSSPNTTHRLVKSSCREGQVCEPLLSNPAPTPTETITASHDTRLRVRTTGAHLSRDRPISTTV